MALPNRFLIFPLIGVSTLLSCGDAHLTSEIAAPPPENPYVAIYRAQCCEGDDYCDRTDLLYKVDRQGNIIPLADEPAPGTFVAELTASPDGHYAAYWEGDRQKPGGTARHSALVIQSLVTADDRQEFLVTTDGPANVQIDWLPDSSGVLLATGEHTDGEPGGVKSQLLLATVNQELPRELVGAELGTGSRLRYQVAADASALAVLLEQVDNPDDIYCGDSFDDIFCIPLAGSLYAADLASGNDLSLLEAATGIANSFNFQWSNDARQLVYQARQLSGFSISPWGLGNSPAGPVKWMDRGQSPHTLLHDYAFPPGPLTPYLWLDGARLVLNGVGGFEIVSTEDGRLAQVVMDSHSVAVPSPDGSQIAYIADDPAGGLAVYVLDPKSGVSQALGPTGSTVFLQGTPATLHTDYYLSALKWSPDGALLAWDKATRNSNSFFPIGANHDYELYVYDFRASRTQQIATLIERDHDGRVSFSWIPGENLLEYVRISGDKRELMLADPLTQRSVLIGEFAGETGTYWRAWHSRSQVLWDSLEGISLAELDAQGAVTYSQFSEGFIYENSPGLQLSENRKYAVAHLYNPTHSEYQRLLYDFESKRTTMLDIEAGSSAGGVIWLE